MWISPRLDDLKETIAESSGGLVLCSPFIGGTALDIVAESLPDAVSSIEIWTKLDQRDYVTGATDPESLRSFVRTVRAHRPVRMRQASNLHAKIVLSNGPVALAGSANLTAGGYLRNLEAVSKVRDEELASLRKFASQLRIKLEPIGIARFERFVKECLAKMGEREALLALIREQATPVLPGAGLLIPYHPAFEVYIRTHSSPMAHDLSVIADNGDGNNNQGKVKHAFFGIQRFLQEYSQHLPTVAALPDNLPVDVRKQLFEADWRQFLQDHAEEANHDYDYRIQTLIGYLTPS